MRSHPFWRVIPVLLLLALGVPAVPAQAQDAGSVLSVDSPFDGERSELGQDVVFRGWAAHSTGPGTGVDRVIVLDAPLAAGGETVAEAVYGRTARADVASTYGAAWANSDFQATWRATGSTGNRTFWVYAHSVANDGWTNKTVTVRLSPATGQPSPAAPANPSISIPSSNQYGTQYGSQYGSQYGQVGQQYVNQYGPYDQYGNTYGQYPYNQYGNQFGNQFGNTYSQYPYNQNSGYAYGAGQCGYSPYSSGTFGSYSGVYGGSSTYGCPGYNSLGLSGPTVVATAATDGTVILTWMPVPFATQYRVYQMTPVASLISTLSQPIGGFSAMTTTVSGLAPGTQYIYQVRAVVGGGSETVAFASWVGTTPGFTTAVAPVTVNVGASTSNTVALTWMPSVSSGVTSYQTSQSLTSGGPFVPSVVSASSTNGATVGSLVANTTYYFQVTAMAGSVSSTPSTVVSALTTL